MTYATLILTHTYMRCSCFDNLMSTSAIHRDGLVIGWFNASRTVDCSPNLTVPPRSLRSLLIARYLCGGKCLTSCWLAACLCLHSWALCSLTRNITQSTVYLKFVLSQTYAVLQKSSIRLSQNKSWGFLSKCGCCPAILKKY